MTGPQHGQDAPARPRRAAPAAALGVLLTAACAAPPRSVDAVLPLARRQPADAGDALGSQRLADDLFLGFAFVAAGRRHPVRGADLAALQVDAALLRSLALRNLSQRPYDIEGDGPVYALTAGGGDAAGFLALHDLWRGLATAMPGDLVATAPTAGRIWFCDSRLASIARLQAAAARDGGAGAPLSDALLVHAGDTWLELRPAVLATAREALSHDVPVAFSVALPQIQRLEQGLPPREPGAPAPQSAALEPGAAVVQLEVAEPGAPQQQTLADGTASLTLAGRRLRWIVDGTPCDDRAEMRRRLAAIFADRGRWQPDAAAVPDSRRGPLLQIEPGPGVRYGDVRELVETARALGFERIDYGVQRWR